MRLFIALSLNESAEDFLKGIKLDARMVKDFHLTLKFLGEISKYKVDDIISSLGEIEITPFVLRLSDAGIFPNERNIRVAWVGVEPKRQIIDLQKKVDESLIVHGFRKEKRFHPHITIARIKHLRDKKGFLKSLNELEIKPVEVSVNSFMLIKSTLTTDGPTYETLKTFINNSQKL